MKYFAWLIILVIIVGGGYWLSRSYTAPPGVPVNPPINVAAPTAPETKAVAREITLESGFFFFKPNRLVLKKGQPVKLTIKNNGTHTFTVDELGINEMLRGSQVTIEFTPNKTGTFNFYCSIPGHRQSGQFGTLVVE